MIWPKVYRYLPTDESTRVYADNLLAYHERQGLSAADADAAAARDLRRFLVEQLAAAASHNQSINQSKANARVQALAYLFFGLISSFAASATIVIGAKYDAPRSAAEESNGQHFKTTEKAGISELRTATEPALPSVNRGGRKAPISAAEIGQVNEVREVQANEAVSKPPRAP
jgi:predicted NBD/HSP70 family sugar kinase